MPDGQKRFFSFSYHVLSKKEGKDKQQNGSKKRQRDFRLHQLRDGQAFMELAAVLTEKGYKYGDLLINHPAPSKEDMNVGKALLESLGLTSSDLIVLTTRPPLDDIIPGLKNKTYVERSNSGLEALIFATVRQYFEMCSREYVKLTWKIACFLEGEARHKAEIQFNTSTKIKDARYIYYRSHNHIYKVNPWEPPHPEEKRSTVAYLLYTPSLYDGGPGLIVSFGLGGQETLIWNYLIRVNYPEYLDSPRFVMAEIAMKTKPERPIVLDFAEKWDVKPLLNLPL